MTHRTTVRELRTGDWPAVGALLRASYSAGPMSDDYLDYISDPGNWVHAASDSFVAVDGDDTPIGVVAFAVAGDELLEGPKPAGGDCGFRFLGVDPKAQGSGAGAALTERCIEEARRRDCRRILIYSMAYMTVAHGIYERRGFTRRPDLDVEFPGGRGVAFTYDLVPDASDYFPPPGPIPEKPPWYEDAWA